jgi:hypothetical protein
MKQRQIILAVVIVGLISAAAWVRHESSQQPETAQGPAQVTALQDAFHQPSSTPAAASDPAPAEASASLRFVPAPTAAPEVQPPPLSAQAEPPPQSVDTPEPAQRRFARGARSDESEPRRPLPSEDAASGESEQN